MDLTAHSSDDDELLWGDSSEPIVPPSTMATDTVMDMGFHPSQNILATGLVNGEVEIYKYSGNEIVKQPMQNDISSWIFNVNEDDVVWNQHHSNARMHPKGGVAAMEFTDDGSYLVSGGSDGTLSVMDCASGKLVIHIPSADTEVAAAKKSKTKRLVPFGKKKLKKTLPSSFKPTNPHKFGISAVNVCDENLVATGDDDGLIAIWDMRQRKPAFVYYEHADYVSQLCYFTDVQELVSSSGDTCLGVYDVRGGKLRDISDKRKDEISCFAFINSTGVNSRTFIPSIIAGTPTGSLPIWKYGSWSRPYDVMEYHPKEVETIISFHGEDTTFNHNIILTGACDGLVRVIQMYPMRRNICQLSARDYTYSHANTLGVGGGMHHLHNSSYIVKRKRGHEAISKMRLSHDGRVLAVSGPDNIVDFVDVSFLNDEKQLDQLRGKAERRHLETLRNMEREVDAREERDRLVLEAKAPKPKPEQSATKKKEEEGEYVDSDDSATDTSSTSSDDQLNVTSNTILREKLLALQRKRREENQKKKEEKRQAQLLEDSEEDERKSKKGKQGKRKRNHDYDSSGDSDMFTSDDDDD
ncbi:WDcontaining protein [Angomonas deanei]|nr:WDcontaining protein [Angomonas deanei]|eukprot:EPY36396.1 WDcontaining protein [Angomonas deanei]